MGSGGCETPRFPQSLQRIRTIREPTKHPLPDEQRLRFTDGADARSTALFYAS